MLSVFIILSASSSSSILCLVLFADFFYSVFQFIAVTGYVLLVSSIFILKICESYPLEIVDLVLDSVDFVLYRFYLLFKIALVLGRSSRPISLSSSSGSSSRSGARALWP